jgi:hypothetical protein
MGIVEKLSRGRICKRDARAVKVSMTALSWSGWRSRRSCPRPDQDQRVGPSQRQGPGTQFDPSFDSKSASTASLFPLESPSSSLDHRQDAHSDKKTFIRHTYETLSTNKSICRPSTLPAQLLTATMTYQKDSSLLPNHTLTLTLSEHE